MLTAQVLVKSWEAEAMVKRKISVKIVFELLLTWALRVYMEVFNPGSGTMAKSNRSQELVSLVQGAGNLGLLLLVITVGALVPIKLIEIVSGRPVLEEFVNFAKEPSLGIRSRSDSEP